MTVKGFFSIELDTPPMPPIGLAMSRYDWESLSPGMRREIHCNFSRPRLPEPLPTAKARKQAVEYAARKRP